MGMLYLFTKNAAEHLEIRAEHVLGAVVHAILRFPSAAGADAFFTASGRVDLRVLGVFAEKMATDAGTAYDFPGDPNTVPVNGERFRILVATKHGATLNPFPLIETLWAFAKLISERRRVHLLHREIHAFPEKTYNFPSHDEEVFHKRITGEMSFNSLDATFTTACQYLKIGRRIMPAYIAHLLTCIEPDADERRFLADEFTHAGDPRGEMLHRLAEELPLPQTAAHRALRAVRAARNIRRGGVFREGSVRLLTLNMESK